MRATIPVVAFPQFEARVDKYLKELDGIYAEIEDWLPESSELKTTNTVFEYFGAPL